MNDINELLLDFLFSIPLSFQFVIIFITSYLEGVPIVGTIVPGGSIAIVAGSISKLQNISLIYMGILVSIASFLGDMTGFLISRKFKEKQWVQKIIYKEEHQKHWDLFDKHLMLIVIFGKLIPVVRSTPSIFAAVRNHNTRKYFVYSLLGSILWGFSGIYLGNLLSVYFADNLSYVLLFIVIISIIALIGKYLWSWIKGR